ncbi:MAG: helix-turn-helix transcriptional regulator [Bacteroidetes bacterium]|nr:helix-turn-helix transcriptional regulator [Bacteroidota bacterium]
MTLGERIKIVRIQKKINQHELAKDANVHQKNISKYENNGVIPSAMTLKSIANVLGVSTDYLLGNKSDSDIKDNILFKYFMEIDKMPDDSKKALMTVIEAYIKSYNAGKPIV